jgi:ABC-type sugar transport system ATPase subunit
VREGEVLGFYGLVGAGRTEIAETLFGLRKPTAGRIFWRARRCDPSPIDAIAKGISLVPESRKEQGLVLGHELPGQHDPAAGR